MCNNETLRTYKLTLFITVIKSTVTSGLLLVLAIEGFVVTSVFFYYMVIYYYMVLSWEEECLSYADRAKKWKLMKKNLVYLVRMFLLIMRSLLTYIYIYTQPATSPTSIGMILAWEAVILNINRVRLSQSTPVFCSDLCLFWQEFRHNLALC
jgi:hypothetical protein